MRSGSIRVVALVLCAAGCGKTSEPSPEPTNAAVPMGLSGSGPATATASATAMPKTARATPASPIGPAPIIPANLQALGTEPFWNARIDGGALTYVTPEDQKGRKTAVERRDTAIGAVFSGKLDGEPLVLTLAKRACSDGMSDRAYPLSAVLTIGSQRRIGCAS